ncbi:hypothetical protein B0H17DRAFT_1093182 [Mycena rosella]|uniref:Uncharacterized protein n=1 Tax=Mycena rosella TaxID=1033263 RepID=A0AAD7CX76_MYCRO|nr:hypothetical protein B0H17DRAFT_1093182 [Mycena rosella]
MPCPRQTWGTGATPFTTRWRGDLPDCPTAEQCVPSGPQSLSPCKSNRIKIDTKGSVPRSR